MALPSPNKAIVSKRHAVAENLSSDEINKFMKKHGIGEKEMAEIFGVTIQAVRLWTSGARTFTVTNSRLIALFNKYPQLLKEF